MYQEEILKAIKEQTKAIERLIEAVKEQTQSLEWFTINFAQAYGADLQNMTPMTANMTNEERKERIHQLLAEINAAQRAKRK